MHKFISEKDNFVIKFPKMPKTVEFGDSKKSRIYQLNRLYTSYNVSVRELYDNDIPKTKKQISERLVSELKSAHMTHNVIKQDYRESEILDTQCVFATSQITLQTGGDIIHYEVIFINKDKIYNIALSFNVLRVRKEALFDKFVSSFRFIKS